METSAQHERSSYNYVKYLSNTAETTLFCFREEVEEFFDRMDRDYDGRLSFEEFMGEEPPIEKLFKNMDKNGDGFVTKKVNKTRQ